MKRTKRTKAKPQQEPTKDLAEEALMIAIKNAALGSETIKALRLTCKRTKAAVDATVKKFDLRLDSNQDSQAVGRSGLLENITNLDIYFDFRRLGNGHSNSQKLSRAVGLLNLAVDVCSKSVEELRIDMYASSNKRQEFGRILGNSDWFLLRKLSLPLNYPNPGFLSGFLKARPGSLSALKELDCGDPGPTDIESLASSVFVGNLTSLSIQWSANAYESNVAPLTVAAMRILLQKATNLEFLDISSSTFEFFDCEQLSSLKVFFLKAQIQNAAPHETVDIAPVLARPWMALEEFKLEFVTLKGTDVIRLFEAQDTLQALKHLDLDTCTLAGGALRCVRRPRLDRFDLFQCENGHALFSKLAQVMKDDAHALPRLRSLNVECGYMGHNVIKGLSKFLSCPSMAALEVLSITDADIDAEEFGIFLNIANHCPNLTYLGLERNKLGRPAMSLLVGYGMMGAWPKLEEMGILEQVGEFDREDEDDNTNHIGDKDINSLDVEHPYMPPLEVQTLLRRAWPSLECS